MRNLLRTLVTTAAASALVVGLAGTAHADGYTALDSAQMEQTVLRAQMPRTLGSWTQNYYFTMNQAAYTRPTVCWNGTGDVKLPAAKVSGAVGYDVASDAFGTVTIYQYASAAKAKAALTAMRKARCSDNPTVTTDEGQKVQADSGSDFTDASRTSIAAALSYAQDDKAVMTHVQTTQRGLAVVQTEIMQAVPSSLSDDAKTNAADRLGSVNKTWHANAVRAYENFGQGTSR